MGGGFLAGTLIHCSGCKLGDDAVNLEKEQEGSGAIQRNEDGIKKALLLSFQNLFQNFNMALALRTMLTQSERGWIYVLLQQVPAQSHSEFAS